jgi:Barnase-EndoU-ColicinE5/D-RelE like nuclease
VLVSHKHARPRPCAPVSVPATANKRRQIVASVLGISTGQKQVAFTDYAGRTITQNAEWICNKMSKDKSHTAYVGWIAETLRNPIEVWDRVDNGVAKLHYFSAYTSGSGVVSYMAVAVTAKGILVTAFQKDSASTIDGKRNGTPVFCCY